MESDRSGLVGIVRDFLLVHRELRAMFARHREGGLDFASVAQLVDDRDGSLLFRLKERCHALFRSGDATAGGVVMSEALFDLAVGSLFHEAMKFRENFYQLEIYGPRVRSLRSGAGAEADELFREFEKILEVGEGRLEEALNESEALLDQTRKQLRVLLLHYREDGLLARCLIEHPILVEEVFPEEGVAGLLAALHGEPAEGYLAAARSYLGSACFDRALDALAEARKRSEPRDDLEGLAHYASGMQGFLDGRPDACLRRLARWVDGGIEAADPAHVRLARDAVRHIAQSGASVDGERLEDVARALLARLDPASS